MDSREAPRGAALPRKARRMRSQTRSFKIGEGKGYLTVACAEDGRPAEVQIRMAKQGSTLAGMMDTFSSTLTRGLASGAPLELFIADYVGTRFEPAGLTNDKQIPQATSVMDYVGRRLALDHLPYETRVGLGVLTQEERAATEPDIDWVGLAMSAPRVAPPRRG